MQKQIQADLEMQVTIHGFFLKLYLLNTLFRVQWITGKAFLATAHPFEACMLFSVSIQGKNS